VSGERGRRGGACGWRIGWLEQPETEWKKLRSPSVSEEAEVANAHEAVWQQVQEEAAQELFDRQSHEPFLVAVGGVAPAEGDVAVGKSNQSAVGNRDAMSVSALRRHKNLTGGSLQLSFTQRRASPPGSLRRWRASSII
jgi:hypothetical protein